MKDSFILYCSHYPTINKLSLEDKGKLLDTVFLYHIEGIEPKFDSFPVEIAFSFLKQQFDRDHVKYDKTVDRNRANGLKGGRPKEPKKPTGLNGLIKEPKKADNDNDSDNDNDNGKGCESSLTLSHEKSNNENLLTISECELNLMSDIDFLKNVASYHEAPIELISSMSTKFFKKLKADDGPETRTIEDTKKYFNSWLNQTIMRGY